MIKWLSQITVLLTYYVLHTFMPMTRKTTESTCKNTEDEHYYQFTAQKLCLTLYQTTKI